MRVLFTTRGSAGHLGPLVPYAAACRSAGHDVLVAAQDRFEANVARTGLPFAPLGAPPDEEWMPLLPEFSRMRLDEGHDRMVADFFGVLDVRAMRWLSVTGVSLVRVSEFIDPLFGRGRRVALVRSVIHGGHLLVRFPSRRTASDSGMLATVALSR